MFHAPAAKQAKDKASEWKASLGIKLFLFYGIIYAGFVGIAVFNPTLMKRETLAGVNLAIVYGMALILFAIILGLVYNYFCVRKEDEMNSNGEAR